MDEWSARRRHLYLTTHNAEKGETSMPPAGFEPEIPARVMPQTHALYRGHGDWIIMLYTPGYVKKNNVVCGTKLTGFEWNFNKQWQNTRTRQNIKIYNAFLWKSNKRFETVPDCGVCSWPWQPFMTSKPTSTLWRSTTFSWVRPTTWSKKNRTGIHLKKFFLCRLHLWFRLMGVCKHSRWRHSVTVPSRHKMVAMHYYGNVMTTTRWWLCITMATLWQQQDGGYALLWKRYDNNKMADKCY